MSGPRYAVWLAAVLALGLVSTACSEDTSDAAAPLYGDWTTGLEGLTVTFESDGSWSVAEGTEQPFDTGTFTFDGSTLTVDTDEGSQGCQAGQTGTYDVTFVDDDAVELELVSDDCVDRGNDFASGLTGVD